MYLVYKGYLCCDSDFSEPTHTIKIFDESEKSVSIIKEMFRDWEESKKSEFYYEKKHDYFRIFKGLELTMIPSKIVLIEDYELREVNDEN